MGQKHVFSRYFSKGVSVRADFLAGARYFDEKSFGRKIVAIGGWEVGEIWGQSDKMGPNFSCL